MLDVVVRLGSRSPPAAMRPISDTGAGGQAANVAAWAASLGAEAPHRARGETGRVAIAEGGSRGTASSSSARSQPARPVSSSRFVGAEGDRTLASDRGVAPRSVRTSSTRPGSSATSCTCRATRCCASCSRRGPPRGLARARSRRRGRSTSRRGPRSGRTGRRFSASCSTRSPPTSLRDEAEWALRRRLLPAATWVLKRGPGGCDVLTADARLDWLPSRPGVDTTGAGDALAAGFLLGGELATSPRRGLEAAARCVATVGAMP